MIDRLRSQWRQETGFDALVELRDELDATLERVRSEGRIKSPIAKCPRCGRNVRTAAPRVSVRAMILSLVRFGIAPAEETYALEKSWAAHRKQNGLDLYGKSVALEPAELEGCDHPESRQTGR
jgi:hypothetical protein